VAFPVEQDGRRRHPRRGRGDGGLVGEVASRIAGSSDLYQANQRLPINSVNFVTCHDGFTLWDLVSYDRKHNEANGEGSRDGTDENLSWNCGVEGETQDAAILALRQRQVRNLVAILFLSQGIPMLLAGDEVLRTQSGNNNTWCQDNPTGWFDWTLVETNEGMRQFVAGLVALRKRHPSLRRRRFLSGRPRRGQARPDILWLGPDGQAPAWTAREGHCLGFVLAPLAASETELCVLLNMGGEGRGFLLPALEGKAWGLTLDTAKPVATTFPPAARPQVVRRDGLYLESHSLVVLEGWDGPMAAAAHGDD